MSKKTGRLLKAPGELVALGSGSAPVKRDSLASSSSTSVPVRPLAPPEKRAKLQPSLAAKPTLAKKLGGDLIGAKKESQPSDALSSVVNTFDIEQFYEVVSGSLRPSSSQSDALLKRCAFYISNNVAKLDNNFLTSLFCLVNDNPEYFRTSVTLTAFSALLHSKPHTSDQRKNAMIPPVISANVLFFAYRHESCWPSEFIAFFIEDALGERTWIERPECSLFVYHLVKSFPTRLPPHLEESIRGSVMKKGFKTLNESIISFQRCLGSINATVSSSLEQSTKFTSDWDSVATIVSDYVRDFISRKQTGETQLQNLLKVMLLACCFPEIRKIASEKLEFWLQNQKIVKLAQDLLMTVCMNSHGETGLEIESVSAIIKLKYASKQKHLSNHFLSCIRQLLSSNPPLARKLIVQHIASAELSPPTVGPRQSANVALLDAAFSVDGGWATNHILADYFGEVILTAKEDPLKGLRSALRDIVAGVKSPQLNLKVFVDVLFKLTDKPLNDKVIRDRVIVCVADIVCLAQQLLVSELIINAFDNFAQTDSGVLGSPTPNDNNAQAETTIRKFQEQVASIQLSATKWWFSLKPTGEALGTGLKTLLMMDPAVNYAQRDGFPSEPERTAIFSILCQSIPSNESMFQTIILAPFALEQHFYSYQLMDVLCGLLGRNASLTRRSLPSNIPFRNADLINNLLDQARYNVDKSYGEYHPLAVTSIYWKAWIVILLAAAVNPSGLGAMYWQKYPTLRYLMEMCMTGYYEFPSAAVASQALQDIAVAEEKKVADDERKAIELLSQKLNAQLGNQVMYFDPTGPARRPPDAFYKEISRLNDQIGIGAMLCKSRDPDFLQALTTQSQTAGRPLPWLRNLILNADDALYVLPCHCVCQFVLDVEQTPTESRTAQELEKCSKLYDQMQTLEALANPNKSKEFQLASQIVINFVSRLSSLSANQRSAARRCLSRISGKMDDFELESLASLPVYPACEGAIFKSLHESLSVTLDVKAVSKYLQFILKRRLCDIQTELREPLVVDICRFLVERRPISLEGPDAFLPIQSSSWSTEQLEMHDKLANLLSDYFSQVFSSPSIQTKKEIVNDQRHVKVSFKVPCSQTIVFDIVIVEAAILLVALRDIKTTAHSNLISTWFNVNAEMRPSFSHVMDPDQMLSRGNPFKQDWLRLILLNSSQPLLIDSVLSYCSNLDLISLVKSFGIQPQVTGRFLEEVDSICVRSPTLSNDLMPTGNLNDARFVLRCLQMHQKRVLSSSSLAAGSKAPGQKFAECITQLIAMKEQQRIRKQSIHSGSSSPRSGPSSPCSAPASPMDQAAALLCDAPASPTGIVEIVKPSAFDCDSFFSLTTVFKTLSSIRHMKSHGDIKQVFNQLETSISSDLISVRDFAITSPGACLMLLDELFKSPFCDLKQFTTVCKRLYIEAGGDWRDIIKSAKVSTELREFIQGEVKMEKEERLSNNLEDDGIASPVDASSTIITPAEIESSSEQQIVKFIFLGQRWTLGDGLRLCSLLIERRDAEVIWKVVCLLLETEREELPRDCHLLFSFIDATFRRPLSYLSREVTALKDSDLNLAVLPDLSDCQIQSLLLIIDRSLANNVDAVVNLLALLVVKYKSRKELFVDWVAAQLAEGEESSEASRMELAMKLYARCPGLLTKLLEKQNIRTLSSLQRLEAVADSTVQTLLLAIGSNDMKRGWVDRIKEATAMCRRLAIVHPALILNNLHLLATLMQGRNTSTSFGQFKTLNHLSVFGNLMNILLILQPVIFVNQHEAALKIVIDCCLEIFQLYISDIEALRSLVVKVAKFLNGLLQTNLPMGVSLLIPHHRPLISKLQMLLRSDVPEIETVDSILESIVHAPSKATTSSIVDSITVAAARSDEAISVGEYSSTEVQDLIDRLERRRHSIEGLLAILIEIEQFTRSRPASIVQFSNQLISLLFEESIQVQYKVHSLLERLVKNVPGSLSVYFDQWLAAFRKAALGPAPPSVEALNLFLKNEAYDMCSLFPERCLLVIEVIFELMVTGRVTTSDVILKCIRELNCDSMFTTSA